MPILTPPINSPPLEPQLAVHGLKVIARIKNEIEQHHGKITFARFMELALYAPGLGYYSAGLQKFGRAGDFVTAPEISPLFGQCIANQCEEVFSKLSSPSLLELGAGTGACAVRIISSLSKKNALPQKYYILEVSADLKEKQQLLLKTECPDFYENIVWLDHLDNLHFEGVIFANEVLDALPVDRFICEDEKVCELYVTFKEDNFKWLCDTPSHPAFTASVHQLKQAYFPENHDYESEFHFILPSWLKTITKPLGKGVVLLIDYGFLAHEFYHPERSTGTLMCHYKHFSHTNPLILPGLQDITAHVNFTQVIESAMALGCTPLGFTSQADFLINCGLLEFFSDLSMEDQYKMAQQIKILTLPSEMGELFKVLALGYNFTSDLKGFKNHTIKEML